MDLPPLYEKHLIRVNQVMDFVEQNLEKDLSLANMADLACMSPFHFHRIFAGISGETLHAFVVRKRIEKIATLMLKYKSRSVADICLENGFDNPVSFARTFKKFYGMSATQLRAQSTGTFDKIVKEKTPSGDIKVSLEKYIEHESALRQWVAEEILIERKVLPARTLAYIRHTGPIEETDSTFFQLKRQAEENEIMPKGTAKWFLLIHDNPAVTDSHKLQQSACLELEKDIKDTPGLGIKQLSRGAFIVGDFELQEDIEFKHAWDAMSIWMLDRGLAPRNGYLFEIFHGNSLFEPGQKHQVRICIPVD